MELKKGLTQSTGDPWYDLTDGGYLNPYKMCAKREDAEKVDAAVRVVKDFFESCEKQIDGFYM